VIYSEPERTRIYRTRGFRMRRLRAAGLLILIAVTAATLGPQLLTSSSGKPVVVLKGGDHGLRSEHGGAPGGLPALPGDPGGALGEADGAVPDGTTVFDDGIPGVAKLDPDLLAALRRAATDAGVDGVDFLVTSGWRSPAYQERLLQEAVSKYGSEQEAERWVATPSTSPHVAGQAADLGSDASGWLSDHGAEYGLCQIYGNEPWHYELRPEAVDDGCPAMYAAPTQDPRMQQ
jgi:D-alanyl-D-alanine carboxypeptidase